MADYKFPGNCIKDDADKAISIPCKSNERSFDKRGRKQRKHSARYLCRERRETFKGPLARYLVLLTKNRKTSWVAVTVRARSINHRLVAFPHAYRSVFVSTFHHRHPNGYRSTECLVVPNSKPIPRSRAPPFRTFARFESNSDFVPATRNDRILSYPKRERICFAQFFPLRFHATSTGQWLIETRWFVLSRFELSVDDRIDLSSTRWADNWIIRNGMWSFF